MTYNPLIPNPDDLISNSALQIQTNFEQLNTLFGRDHIKFDATSDSGKHNHVTLVQQSSDPSTVALEGAVYTKDISGSMKLVYRDQNDGSITQLIPQGSFSGSSGTLLLGNMRLNFGSITVNSGGGQGSGTATFATAFSGSPYSVIAQPTSQGGSAADNHWVSAASATSCTITQQGVNFITARTFYYLAIGPA